MKKASIQNGVGELAKIKSTCKMYALASEYVENTIKGYSAEVFGKDDVLEAVAGLRGIMMEGQNIYFQVGDICARIEDSIKED